jgi:acetyltransferase-like isoleucine patch superfamily enzyme
MKISRSAIIHPSVLMFGDDIEIGDCARIDAFCVLTGKIRIGVNVHVGCFGFLSGGEGITLDDYVGISPRASLFTASDDYSGESMSNPTIPAQFKPHIDHGPIKVNRHVLLGTNVVIMPGVTIGEGCAVGSFSFVSRNTDGWGIYAGVPAKRIKERSRRILELEKEFKEWRQRQAT